MTLGRRHSEGEWEGLSPDVSEVIFIPKLSRLGTKM